MEKTFERAKLKVKPPANAKEKARDVLEDTSEEEAVFSDGDISAKLTAASKRHPRHSYSSSSTSGDGGDEEDEDEEEEDGAEKDMSFNEEEGNQNQSMIMEDASDIEEVQDSDDDDGVRRCSQCLKNKINPLSSSRNPGTSRTFKRFVSMPQPTLTWETFQHTQRHHSLQNSTKL